MPKEPGVNLTRLDQLMKEKGWGYGELAQYSGVKYDTVYSLAKGRRPNNNIITIKKIADALETSLDYLLGESDDRKPPAQLPPEPIRRLAQIAGDLSAVRQEELVRIATALAELEREQAGKDVTSAAMRTVFQIADQLHKGASQQELFALIQTLERNLPARWLIDLRPADEPTDKPAQSD